MKTLVLGAICTCLVQEMTAVSSQRGQQTHHLREVSKSTPPRPEADRVAMELAVAELAKNMMKTHSWRGKPNEDKRKTMDMINAFRAHKCAKMKEENGKKFKQFDECHKFMEKVCNPGKDLAMDGDGKEVTTGNGHCEEYFDAEKEVEDIKKELGTETGAPGPAPAAAPAASPAASPAGAAPAAPAGPTMHPTKWYFKEGGKWSGRMHMNEKLHLPEQGFDVNGNDDGKSQVDGKSKVDGKSQVVVKPVKLVAHDDGKTITSDWRKEFGPQSELRTYAEICKDHPDNSWCQQFRVTPPTPRSLGVTQTAHLMSLAIVCSALLMNLW